MSERQSALVEILTEELPPKTLPLLSQSFASYLAKHLMQDEFSFDDIQAFATPRRLAVIITALTATQPTKIIQKRGPALTIAFDENGNPSNAAIGFAISCGVAVHKLKRLTTSKGSWLMYRQTLPGSAITEKLPVIVETALKNLPIEKKMRWSDDDTIGFARPIRGVMLLYGTKVIPATMFGVSSGNHSIGHRFHHNKKITMTHARHYQDKMIAAKVIVDANQRCQIIKQQSEQLAKKHQGNIVFNKALLDEVTHLVEWPVALSGQFDKKFLVLPQELLLAVMTKHQKCFAIKSGDDQLLPYFILISNISSKKPQQVIGGNERVMRARLSDANFFYHCDIKCSLFDRVDCLKKVLFQQALGSLYDKTQRLIILTNYLATIIGANISLAKRAALLAKTDLVTTVVAEFPELQGIMGYYYAKRDHESTEVAIALQQQYLPRFSKDCLPSTAIGQALAIADRLDTLIGIVGINKLPSGNKDPFGLRRAALGILRIIIEKRLAIDLPSLVAKAYQCYQGKLSNQHAVDDTLRFIEERHRQLTSEYGFALDAIAAVAACRPKHLVDFHYRLQALGSFLQKPLAKTVIAINKRVKNILTKNQQAVITVNITTQLLKHCAEKKLFHLVTQKCLDAKNPDVSYYTNALEALIAFNDTINEFFDNVMIMVKDKAIRANRLAMLMALQQRFLQVADLSLLQEKT